MNTALAAATIRKNLHQYIETATDEKVMAIYTILEREIADITEYNNDIEEAEREIARGDFYTHRQVLEKVKNWEK